MQKVIVIGSPGAGKSYFSKQLNILLDLPLIHLDNLYWNADKTHLSSEEFDKRLSEVMAGESWIYRRGQFLRSALGKKW